MPYNRNYKRYTKRNYPKRKRNNKVSRYLGYAGSAASTASKALAVAYGIKKLMNVEFKFHDVQQTLQVIDDTTATILQLTNIPQGDTDESRDGAQVRLTRINLRIILESSAVATAFFTEVRVILVHDRQTNQAIYALSDLISDVTASDNLISPLNLDNKYRFQILHNHLYTMNVQGISNRYININKNLDMKLRFDASTPSIADLTSSSLSLVLLTNQSTNQPTATVFSRIRYVDN